MNVVEGVLNQLTNYPRKYVLAFQAKQAADKLVAELERQGVKHSVPDHLPHNQRQYSAMATSFEGTIGNYAFTIVRGKIELDTRITRHFRDDLVRLSRVADNSELGDPVYWIRERLDEESGR